MNFRLSDSTCLLKKGYDWPNFKKLKVQAFNILLKIPGESETNLLFKIMKMLVKYDGKVSFLNLRIFFEKKLENVKNLNKKFSWYEV